MAEGDAWSHAKQLALTIRRIRFRQTQSLQEENYARYTRELAQALDRLVSELNHLLTVLCRSRRSRTLWRSFRQEMTKANLS
jgi:hypothetical protein